MDKQLQRLTHDTCLLAQINIIIVVVVITSLSGGYTSGCTWWHRKKSFVTAGHHFQERFLLLFPIREPSSSSFQSYLSMSPFFIIQILVNLLLFSSWETMKQEVMKKKEDEVILFVVLLRQRQWKRRPKGTSPSFSRYFLQSLSLLCWRHCAVVLSDRVSESTGLFTLSCLLLSKKCCPERLVKDLDVYFVPSVVEWEMLFARPKETLLLLRKLWLAIQELFFHGLQLTSPFSKVYSSQQVRRGDEGRFSRLQMQDVQHFWTFHSLQVRRVALRFGDFKQLCQRDDRKVRLSSFLLPQRGLSNLRQRCMPEPQSWQRDIECQRRWTNPEMTTFLL